MEFTVEDLAIAKEIQDYQYSDREINMPPMSIGTLAEIVHCINEMQIGIVIDEINKD